MLGHNFEILLFPAIGDIRIVNGKLQITNEGKGSLRDPYVAFSQNGVNVLEAKIQDVIAAGKVAMFQLSTMAQRSLLSMDPDIRELHVRLRFRKYGKFFELHRTVRADGITDVLREYIGSEIIHVSNSEDLWNLVKSFFSANIRHRVEQDEGYRTLTESADGESERRLRDEKELQVTLKHWLEDLCRPYGIDINRETQTGRGPVDFKFSIGKSMKCIVEVKLWDSPKLEHGLSIQLPTYLQSEKASFGIYVVVAASQESYQRRIQELENEVQNLNETGDFRIELVVIQAWRKPSASKAQSYDDPERYSALNLAK
jgi:hypothetical protein